MFIRDKRSISNNHGIRDVKEDENPFLNPCIVVSVPFGGVRSINGYFSKIIDLLGLRYGRNVNSGIDLSQVPLSLINDRYGKEINEKLLQAIPVNDKEKAKEILRNITIFSYCDGHDNTNSIIMNIRDILFGKGYSLEEIDEMMLQIVVLQVVANFSKGVFPYVTSVVFHDIYDIENTSWVDLPKEEFPSDSYSKVIVSQVNENCSLVLNSSFGKGSLKEEYPRDHTFTNDYYDFPVLGNLLSLCFINSLARSIDNRNIRVNDILENSHELLKMAKGFEDKYENMEELSKEELREFKESFSTYLYDYFKRKVKYKDIDQRDIELDLERIDVIQLLTDMGLYSLSNIYEISRAVSNILKYSNYDKDEVVNIRIGNSGEIPFVVRDFIKNEIIRLNSYIKELVNVLNNIVLPDTVSIEIRKELEEYKHNLLANILSDEVKSIISEYEVELVDKEIKKM